MNSFNERLMVAIDYAKTNQTELALAVGISQPSIQYLCKRGTGSKHLTQIANALKVDVNWLSTGEGSMEARASDAPPIMDVAVWQELPPKVRAFIEDTLDKFRSNQITLNDISFLQTMADKFSASNKHIPV
jgi:hypothetical protein